MGQKQKIIRTPELRPCDPLGGELAETDVMGMKQCTIPGCGTRVGNDWWETFFNTVPANHRSCRIPSISLVPAIPNVPPIPSRHFPKRRSIVNSK